MCYQPDDDRDGGEGRVCVWMGGLWSLTVLGVGVRHGEKTLYSSGLVQRELPDIPWSFLWGGSALSLCLVFPCSQGSHVFLSLSVPTCQSVAGPLFLLPGFFLAYAYSVVR